MTSNDGSKPSRVDERPDSTKSGAPGGSGVPKDPGVSGDSGAPRDPGRRGESRDYGDHDDYRGTTVAADCVIGVGASAGGLEALEVMLANLPPHFDAAMVVVQHLSPDFDSRMRELLQRVTTVPVVIAQDNMVVRPRRIYVIPPGFGVTISGGKLRLPARLRNADGLNPIDHFFESLSTALGHRGMAIILSGTGSDGTRGAAAVGRAGGLVMVQEPSTCGFASMPQSVIDHGYADLSHSLDGMGDLIVEFSNHELSKQRALALQTDSLSKSVREKVFDVMGQAFKLRFDQYKTATIDRRISRRILLGQFGSAEEYIRHLETNPEEVSKLHHDLLISVTHFFRDPQAFEYLQKEIIPSLVAKNADEGIRVWVCACCTGEEAYSIAMLIIEEIERDGRDIPFKLFATDANRESLHFAATGIYSEARMVNVSPERRLSFFNKRPEGYFVNSFLRRHVVFAPHDVLTDPPFTQMNLVTCRNLLIYIRSPAQRKMMAIFHFAMLKDAYLFLGMSETLAYFADEFAVVHQHWKLYRKLHDNKLPSQERVAAASKIRKIPSRPPSSDDALVALRSKQSEITRTSDQTVSSNSILPIYDALLSNVMQAGALVDDRHELLHIFEGSQEYFRVPTGRTSSSAVDLVSSPLRNTLSAALRRSAKSSKTIEYRGLPHPSDRSKTVRMMVRGFDVEVLKTKSFLIQFQSVAADVDPLSRDDDVMVQDGEGSEARIADLESDLSETRSSLHETIEQLETNNEELRANNEEMVAANEELQSTNEELQSVNEELYTVNAEHQKRVLELDEANADMKNLLASTRAGVIFLDREFYIRRFTPEITRILKMQPNDIGRNISNFLQRIDNRQFETLLDRSLRSEREEQIELRVDGDDFLARVMPYWRRGEVSGVVVSFVDVSPLRRAESEVTKFKLMADVNTDAQVLINRNGDVIYANESMADALQYEVKDLLKMSVFQFDTEVDEASFRERFDAAVHSSGSIFESNYIRRNGSIFPVEIAVTFVSVDEVDFVFANVRDISMRREAENERMLLQKAIETIDNGILITDATADDNPITFCNDGFLRMTGYEASEVIGRNCRFLQGENTDREIIGKIRQAIDLNLSSRSLLQNYRKDGTPFWNDLYLTPVRDDQANVTHFVGVQNDVTERIRIGDQARINEQTVRSLLDSTAEGIFGLDPEGVFSFCNPSAARLLGYDSVESLVGRKMHSVVQPVDGNGNAFPVKDSNILATIRSGQISTRRDEVFIKADGEPLSIQWWCHPINSGDEVLGGVVTFVDDTERQRFEQELRDARDAADAANQSKSRFLATMSHELRTPLAAILGFAEILQQEIGDQKHHEKLAVIRRNGDYLLRLVNDVLDLSRIEVGKFMASPVSVSLDELINDVRETMLMRTDDSSSSLHFELRSKLPATVTIDPARLRQVLINLIANALKFSPGGDVVVGVSLDRTDPTHLSFEVKDNGIGMSEEQMKHLFQPFVQADSSISERFGGTGLGLSITRRLLDAMNGRVTVQSQLGQGSVFTVYLPVDPCSSPIELKLGDVRDIQSSAVSNKPPRRLDEIQLNARVLIADDMPDIRFIAQHFLAKHGCDIEVVENGRLAVDRIKESIGTEQAFDLILMDMQMPVLDGIGAVKELRQSGIDIPVIALTADAMKGTRRRLLSAGFDRYLSKPLDVEKLIFMVVSLID